MVVASFLVKHLLISWEDGAGWFWDTLADADLANNTLGWQWVVGCGADETARASLAGVSRGYGWLEFSDTADRGL